jgi:sulfite reductase (ferredoxin)
MMVRLSEFPFMPSPVEQIKETSRGLRGTILQTLQSDATHFSEEEYQLLKFHGSYQQDDRDLRTERKKQGLDKAWSFMLRTKLPGGDIRADQYLVLDRLCEDLANGTMRITTRQGIQFHGIQKGGFKECVNRIYKSGITTWGACGDVVRNTMGPSSPIHDDAHQEAQKLARQLSDTFLAKSRAYAEIWIDGEKITDEIPEEPIYGKLYLPRKFKIGIVIPPRNDVDVYSQDLGFIAHAPNGKVEGYTVLVGGGFGMTHGMTKTFPKLALPLFYVKKEHAVEAAIAIVIAQRDHGNREDRKRSRLKYVIDEKGIDWFRKEVLARLKAPTEPAKAFRLDTVADMLGWHEQGDGKLFCGIWVSEGRIQDTAKVKYRSAFRTLAEKLKLPIRLTPNCNILFYNIPPTQKDAVNQILQEFQVPHTDTFTEARKTSHACVALPTCGLALAESERTFPGVMDQIDQVLRDLKLEKEPILFRMSGCPNGCSRPYNADFAFVGRAPNKYAFFVGGSIVGDRLVGLEKKAVELKDIASAVRPYLEEFAKNRKNGETFTAYWGRTHQNGPSPTPEQFHIELAERAARLTQSKVEAIEHA